MVNPNFSLDIRNYAKSQLEPEEEAFLKKHTRDSIKTSNTANPPANNSNSEPKERKERIQRDDEIKDDPSAPTVVAPAAPAIIIAPSDREEIEAEKALMRANQNPAPAVPVTVAPVTPVTPPAATIKTDDEIEQEFMEKRQKTVAQSPIKTPTPTPNTAMEQFRCGERGGDWINGQCQSPGSTPTPKPTAATPKPTSTPERLTKLYSDNTCGGLKSGERCVLVQGTGQYGIVQSSSATVISYNSGATAGAPTSPLKPSEEPQTFWQQLSSNFNNAVKNTDMVGMGTGGLGMDGNTTAIPMSIITSDNPEDLNNYLTGQAYAGAAGIAIGATVIAAPVVYSAGPAIVAYGGTYGGAAIATLPTAVQTGITTVGSAVALATPYLATKGCIDSGDPNSPACIGLVTGYMANPIEAEQALVNSWNNLSNPLKYSLTPINKVTNDIENTDYTQLRQQIRDQISAGGENSTIKLANQEVDKLVSQGMNELEAITKVGSGIAPNYANTAEEIAQLNIANTAKTADQVMQCEYTWCRHNKIISNEILESRGYSAYSTNMKFQSGGGHVVSAIMDDGIPIFVDITNNKLLTGVESLTDLFSNNGSFINQLDLWRQANNIGTNPSLDVINLITP